VRIFDWGWIGLLGLAGLVRLAKHHKEAVPYKHSNGMNHLDPQLPNEQAVDGMNATDEQSIKLYEERIIAVQSA